MKFLKKLTCFVLALSLFSGVYSLLGNNFTGAFAEGENATEQPTATLEVALNVGQNIALKAIAALPSGASGVKTTFNWNDGEVEYSQTIESSSEDCAIDGDTYTFTYRGITPEYMANVVNITVEYDDGEKLTGSQSVKGYLEALLSAKPASVSDYAYEYLKTLAYDLLDYGAAAQTYKGETDSTKLVNGGVENGNGFSADEVTDKYEATTQNVKWGAGARYDYSVKPVVKFTLKDTSKVTENSQVYAKVKFGDAEEKQVEVEKAGDNEYIAVLNDFDLLKADEVFTVTAYVDGVAFDSLTSDFASIAKKVYAYTENLTSDIIVATYVYAKSAIAYSEASLKKEYIFEAEEAILYSVNGVTSAKEASSAHGGRYIDSMGNDGDGSSLTWKISAENACSVNITAGMIRHHQYTRNVDEFFEITINGELYKTGVTIEKTGGSAAWTTFYDFDILKNVKLKKGENVIVFKKIGWVLNLDYIKIYSAEELIQTEKELKIEAENCTLVGATIGSASDSNNPSGGKYVGGLGTANRTISFVVTAETACKAQFILCYGNRTSISDAFTTRFTFALNSETLLSGTVSNKGTSNDWYGWEEYVICEVDLVAGENTIVVATLGKSGTSNIDYFKLISSESLTFKKA